MSTFHRSHQIILNWCISDKYNEASLELVSLSMGFLTSLFQEAALPMASQSNIRLSHPYLSQVQDCHVVKHLSKEEYNGHTAALIVGGKNVSPFHVSKISDLNLFFNNTALVHTLSPPHNKPLSLHLFVSP